MLCITRRVNVDSKTTRLTVAACVCYTTQTMSNTKPTKKQTRARIQLVVPLDWIEPMAVARGRLSLNEWIRQRIAAGLRGKKISPARMGK